MTNVPFLNSITNEMQKRKLKSDVVANALLDISISNAKLDDVLSIQSSASEIDAVVKLGKLRNSKQLNLFNTPINTKATTTSVGTAPSFIGYTRVTPVSQGWELSFTANTIEGSSVLTNVSSISGLVVGQLIYQSQPSGYLMPDTIPMGAKIVSIDSATQITISLPCLLNSTSKTILASNKNIKIIGGNAGGFNNSLFAVSTTVASATPKQFGTGYALEFWADAGNISTSLTSVILQIYTNGVTPNSYKIAIDDVYQTELPQANPVNGTNYITIGLLEAGIHKIRIELPAFMLCNNLYILNNSKIWCPNESNNVRVCFFGDSWMANGDVSYGGWSMANIANRVAVGLGWDIFNSSVGGTGYIRNGITNFNWQSEKRLDNTAIENFDAIIVFGSVNDSGNSTSQMKTAALGVWQGIRLRNPNATIFIFGVPTTENTLSASATSIENGLKEAFVEWQDKNSYFFPITTDSNGAWLDSNNVAVYMGDDGTHPNNICVPYIANKMINAINGVINK